MDNLDLQIIFTFHNMPKDTGPLKREQAKLSLWFGFSWSVVIAKQLYLENWSIKEYISPCIKGFTVRLHNTSNEMMYEGLLKHVQ